MSVIGETLTVLSSHDPTQVGRKGRVVLETANTLLLESEGRIRRVVKGGTTFKLDSESEPLAGSRLAGRLQDRLGRNRR